MYEVVLTREAQRTYRKADTPLTRKLNHCFENLSRDPYSHPNIKRLTGTLRGLFRYRVGDWRVVYSIGEEDEQVIVLVIVHRSGAYH
jgi:mRNA interferase RelE/StbE